MAVLFLELSPEEVDVNVHPAKAEVRFRDSSRVFTGLQRAVRRALLSHTAVPTVEAPLPRWVPPGTDQNDPRQAMAGEHGSQAWDLPVAGRASATTGADRPLAATSSDAAVPSTPPPAYSLQAGALRAPLLRLVGQVASTYLVAEGPDGLYLVDQHAAHERVLFERLMSQHESTTQQAVQALLSPVAVELPPASARLLAEQLPLLAHLGFQVEPFGPGTFLVRTLPALLAHMDPAAALKVIVEDFEEDETPLQAEIEARLAARVCKRAAVKGGQALSLQEQSALLTDLQACASPRTCPHGRPTMIHLPVDLLERQFGRKGAR